MARRGFCNSCGRLVDLGVSNGVIRYKGRKRMFYCLDCLMRE